MRAGHGTYFVIVIAGLILVVSVFGEAVFARMARGRMGGGLASELWMRARVRRKQF